MVEWSLDCFVTETAIGITPQTAPVYSSLKTCATKQSCDLKLLKGLLGIYVNDNYYIVYPPYAPLECLKKVVYSYVVWNSLREYIIIKNMSKIALFEEFF